MLDAQFKQNIDRNILILMHAIRCASDPEAYLLRVYDKAIRLKTVADWELATALLILGSQEILELNADGQLV